MIRFYEKKDHLIRRNPNLTDEQKAEIIELLGRHPSYENKIDWNKSKSLTYENFLDVLRPLYINELDPRGLVEGQDYDILYESDDEVLYSIYSYDASRILASNAVKPELWTKIPSWCGEEEFRDEAHAFGHFDSEHEDMKPGAKWCISMQTSDKYWNDYSKDIHFLFWFRYDNRLGDEKKIAISVLKKTWEVVFLYNGADTEIRNSLPSYIKESINNEEDDYKRKEKEIKRNSLISLFTFNPQTNKYDYNDILDLDRNNVKAFVAEDGDGFTINFGKIAGNFDCSNLGLKSLKGAPTEVDGFFLCNSNKLTSLKGAPQKVGREFYCSSNQLTSLEGAPKEVGWGFYCYSNQLTSLKGAPQIVGEKFDVSFNNLTSLEGAPQKIDKDFDCSNNQITSLKGAPQEVGGTFNCSYNYLTSLKGAPKEVGGDFYCQVNQLTSLEGATKELGKSFYCSNNKLTSLKGAPKKVNGDFNCYINQLISLEGAPQKVGRNFNCSYNQLTSLKGAPTEVGGRFECRDNNLTSLNGAPKRVGKTFDCSNNPSLDSLDGIGEVNWGITR